MKKNELLKECMKTFQKPSVEAWYEKNMKGELFGVGFGQSFIKKWGKGEKL